MSIKDPRYALILLRVTSNVIHLDASRLQVIAGYQSSVERLCCPGVGGIIARLLPIGVCEPHRDLVVQCGS